ncbi:hypothetical protein CRUP_007690 [Coryphaenoides rupestris]|nr:hypothetical protein CRUP_007690 [Coryphaenoides rupestris]
MSLLLAEQEKEQHRLQQVLSVEQHKSLCRLTAVARGYLTRRLLVTEKVKYLRQTVGEEQLALLQQDRELRAERKLREMEKAKSPKDRVVLSAATQRSLDRKKRVVDSPAQARKASQKAKCSPTNRYGVAGPTPLFPFSVISPCSRHLHNTPALSSHRILKTNQGQNAPASDKLKRQGSWYRKTPEDRVKRSDSLKKQNSLG